MATLAAAVLTNGASASSPSVSVARSARPILAYAAPLDPVQQWSATPFHGSRATLASDVNADGKDDLIAVNDDATFVMLSNGTAFGPALTPPPTPTPITPAQTATPTTTPTPTPQVVVRIQRTVVYFPGEAISVRHEWRAFKRYTRVSRLTVLGIPRNATLALRCNGGECPFARRPQRFPNGARTASLTKLFKQRKLRIGATLEVQITATDWVGRLVRFKMRASRIPSVTVRCLRPGAKSPSRC
jgi:hypothetical protein